MTPQEYAKAVAAFEKSINGQNPKVCTYIALEDGCALRAAVYSNWPMDTQLFEVKSDTFPAVLAALNDKWAEYAAKHRLDTIRKMALEIIRITAEKGECTDATLRGSWKFSEDEIRALGAEACADADMIAGKGPFKIKATRGANAPADAVPA